MQTGTVDGAFEASADNVNFSLDGNDGHVVARSRQGRGRAPGPRSRIKNFVGCDHDAVKAAATDHMNLAVDRGGTDGASRRLHGRKHAPLVGCRIVREST